MLETDEHGQEQLRGDLQDAIREETELQHRQQIAQQRMQNIGILRQVSGITSETDAKAQYETKRQQAYASFMAARKKAEGTAENERTDQDRALLAMTTDLTAWNNQYDMQNLGIQGLGARDVARKKAQDDYRNNRGYIQEIQSSAL